MFFISFALALFKRKNITKIVFKLYFFNDKRFIIFCLLIIVSFSLLAQEQSAEADAAFVPVEQEQLAEMDTAFVVADTLIFDVVVPQPREISPSAVDKQVTYSAVGEVRRDIVNQRVILTNQAVVRYGDIEIQADSIVFNMANDIVYAIGRRDSTGTVIGSPVFKETSNEFKSDELTYNFKSKMARIKNITTMQSEGLVRSQYAKLLEDGTSNIALSTYSTCDADPPHFYINMPRARVYPNEKIVSGPANLVIEGIPLPLVIPFGFFPINNRNSASGILFPKYGQERVRGYSLERGGYYFAINDYVDLTVQGDIFTNGTWLMHASSKYKKLYKFDGDFNFSYAENVIGQKGLNNYGKEMNYTIGWRFNQANRAPHVSRFSASVNMSSSKFDRENSYDVESHTATNRTSSINYTKPFVGKIPANFSISMDHRQNNKTKQVDVNLPTARFNTNRIYPFKMGKQTSNTKWYQELELSYTAALENRISTTDSMLFTRHTLENMKNGFKHDIPLSLQIKPFKGFSISPRMTYSGVLYTQKIEKTWDNASQQVVTDTTRGVFYGHAMTPSVSVMYNTQIFGMFAPLNQNSRVQAIRHVMTPSVSFNFTPDAKGLISNMHRTVQADSTGKNYSSYSIFDGGIYGTPSTGRKSGSVSLGLTNMIEAKVFAKGDTAGTAKKVKIIDNFGVNTSYNLFAESMKWSDVSMNARKTFLGNVNIEASSNYSIYALDSTGKQIDRLFYQTDGKLLRFKNLRASTGLDFGIHDIIKKMTGRQSSTGSSRTSSSSRTGFDDEDDDHDHFDDYYYPGYDYFDMPWTLNIRYSLSYDKVASQKYRIRQTLSANGNVTFTKNMTATVTTGYDFDYKKITMTNIGIQRDLHCWTMSFNWVPNGSMQRWDFTIRAKASILRDLKYDRRKDFRDVY